MDHSSAAGGGASFDGVHELHLPQVGSTSTRLKELIVAGQVSGPTVLSTDHQTAGRGTRTRTWVSAPPEQLSSGQRARDLALTYGSPWPELIDPRLSLAIGVLLAEAIERATKLKLALKWPNDLLAGDPPRKVGGVLLEHTHGWLLVGVGLNVNSRESDFPPDLQAQLTTLSALKRGPLDVSMLKVAVTRALRQVPAVDLQECMRRFRERDCTAGTRYVLNRDGKQVQVTAAALADDGALLLHDAAGTEHRVASFTELERV